MSTPLGWARANLIYDKHVGVPKYGTLTEALCLLVWRSRVGILLAQTRAQAQAAIGGDSAKAAFEEFRDLVNRSEVKAKKDKMQERLEQLQTMKEIRFRPIAEPTKVNALPKTVRGSNDAS
jgi:hypothetical protein